MNVRSLCLTTLVAFVTVWATDFLIHAVWLSATYGATKELWRPEAEMIARMPWMFLGQFCVAVGFTIGFAGFVAEKRNLAQSLLYAACIGALVAGGQIIMYAVQPFPGSLVVKWCVGYFAQMLLLGAIVHAVYKPMPAAATRSSQP